MRELAQASPTVFFPVLLCIGFHLFTVVNCYCCFCFLAGCLIVLVFFVFHCLCVFVLVMFSCLCYSCLIVFCLLLCVCSCVFRLLLTYPALFWVVLIWFVLSLFCFGCFFFCAFDFSSVWLFTSFLWFPFLAVFVVVQYYAFSIQNCYEIDLNLLKIDWIDSMLIWIWSKFTWKLP